VGLVSILAWEPLVPFIRVPTVRTNRWIIRALAYLLPSLAYFFAGNSSFGSDPSSSDTPRFEDLVNQGDTAEAQFDPEKARRSFEQVLAMPCREIYDSNCREQAQRPIASL